MRINPPKKVTVWVSIFVFVVGMLLSLNLFPAVPVLAIVGVILTGLSYLLLIAGLFIKGL
ncbi:MAG: hypothetical protein R2912_07795 [Eubacteriales bacterium]